MVYRVRVLKGMAEPNIFRYGLSSAEALSGLWVRIILALLSSAFLFTLSGFLGIGSESLSGQITRLSPSEFETAKLVFLCGQLLSGLLYAGIILFFFGLFFHILFDIEYKKILAVQLIALTIGLVSKAVSMLMAIFAGIGTSASPLSFGVIGHYLTDFDPLRFFLGQISVFQIAIIAFQFYMFRSLSEKKPGFILLLLILLHMLFWIIQAVLLAINLGKFL
ncbi:hypothetical protein JOC77_000128 [Peribacillus deserti]|uniref:Yip1 domain-containing protein n=1 Tax=Peribacillus deserti TaxID=673318 RepID=A0ABS2QC49_9BACI|nr:hypothetical protein [Peribacillus deserti]MBM7690725.1 hypothetical protein [Peribacillus deserti]